MSEVADLFAMLGLKVNESQWSRGDAKIGQMRNALGRFTTGAGAAATGMKGVGDAAESAGKRGSSALGSFGSALASTVSRAGILGASLGGLAAFFGQRMVRSGVELNSTLEDSKTEVAGMLALANKTHLSDEMKNADMLVDNLQRQAAKLPGKTAEYVAMLSMITQPITDAKLGLKDLEAMTVSSVVAAKGLHVPWEVAARDIDQALRGQYHSVDPFSGKVLGSLGYKGEEGRSRYNELSDAKRASEFRRALAQPQFAELGAAQGKSFSGVVSTMMDAWDQLERKVTRPLFEKLGEQITRLNTWFDENQVKISAVAERIGTVLVGAFDAVVKAIRFFVTHATFAKSLLIAIGVVLAGLAIAWIAGFWPIFAVIAALTGLIYLIEKLLDYPGGIEQAFSDAFEAVADAASELWETIKGGFKIAFDAVADLPVVKHILQAVDKLGELKHWGDDTTAASTPQGPLGLASPKIETEGIFGKIESVMKLMSPGTIGSGVLDFAPRVPTGAAPPASLNVSVGDINIHSPNADPVAVGDQVRKVFHEELGNTLRKAQDVYG